jgi:abortive infection bacteriophage resistance protein
MINQLKPPLAINQQLQLLVSRGMIINDRKEASQFLIDNNYYRLNAYLHKFLDNQDHFFPNTNFSKIMEFNSNDIFLRKQIVSLLEPIEIKIKTVTAYHLGCKYGSDAFYNSSIFKNQKYYGNLFQSFTNDVNKRPKDPIVYHHNRNYSGKFPIWVVVELFTFHSISQLYSILQLNDQKSIAQTYFGINEQLLENWIHSLSVIRNICAHYGYLFKREFTVPVGFGKDKSKYPNLENKLFGIFYCLKMLSKQDHWKAFYTEVVNNISEDNLKNEYGFPSNLSQLS